MVSSETETLPWWTKTLLSLLLASAPSECSLRCLKLFPINSHKIVTQARITSSLDYCNAPGASILEYIIRRMQTVQNTVIYLLLNLPACTLMSSHLKALHWRPMLKCAIFKLLCHTHKALPGTGLHYLRSGISLSSLLECFAPMHAI